MTDEFFWIGNHPGLDFLNTAAVDAGGRPLALLRSWDDVATWAATAGLVGPTVTREGASMAGARSRRRLDWARKLRTAARQVLDPDSNDHLRGARTLAATVAEVPVRLTYQPDKPAGGPPVAPRDPADRLRLALAVAVLDATRLDRSRIRRCESDRCVLLYCDTSRNRSRRWCDMSACGNRAKAAAHYQRTKERRASPRPHSRGPASVSST